MSDSSAVKIMVTFLIITSLIIIGLLSAVFTTIKDIAVCPATCDNGSPITEPSEPSEPSEQTGMFAKIRQQFMGSSRPTKYRTRSEAPKSRSSKYNKQEPKSQAMEYYADPEDIADSSDSSNSSNKLKDQDPIPYHIIAKFVQGQHYINYPEYKAFLHEQGVIDVKINSLEIYTKFFMSRSSLTPYMMKTILNNQ